VDVFPDDNTVAAVAQFDIDVVEEEDQVDIDGAEGAQAGQVDHTVDKVPQGVHMDEIVEVRVDIGEDVGVQHDMMADILVGGDNFEGDNFEMGGKFVEEDVVEIDEVDVNGNMIVVLKVGGLYLHMDVMNQEYHQ
jgi:hypothetical protein